MFNTVLTKLAKVIAPVGCLWAVGCSTDVRRYDDVLTLWRKGDVVADADGILQLPEKYKTLSGDGNAYVTKFAGGKQSALLFILSRGKATNIYGILYTDLAPPPQPGSELTVRMTTPPGPGQGTAMIPFDEQVIVDKTIKSQWYYVYHNRE